jgi:acyl-CoA thioester hydrolase
MFKTMIEPRAGDIDFLGHVNNCVLASWFECARNQVFDLFRTPEQKTHISRSSGWPFIMAHSEYDFRKQIYFMPPVEVRSYIEKIGTKSFTIYHQAWQEDGQGTPQLCVEGRVVIVYYDHEAQASRPRPDVKRALLMQHLRPGV